MEQPLAAILRRSSDAVVIIGLADGRILDVNEAFFTGTGHARRELVGRSGRDLLVGFGQTDGFTGIQTLHELGAISGAPTSEAPIGLWARSGELRVADLSALILELEGQQTAICTIRAMRDPTPAQRRSVAQEELARILRAGGRAPERAVSALQGFGGSLRWEFGAIWRADSRVGSLSCVAVWRSPQSDLARLEEVTRQVTYPPGMEPLGRTWIEGKPIWVPDAWGDTNFRQRRGGAGEPMHGWLVFPAVGREGVIGVVEFLSRETRQPDPELQELLDDVGRLFGRILEGDGVPDARRVNEAGAVPFPAAPPASVLADVRELEALTAGINKLNRLLEHAAVGGDRPVALAPPGSSNKADVEPLRGLPTGLTLKAVSRRTGIPPATLRTWEHRYGFLRPSRSTSGYRLYGDEEIARIERVKYLVGQGVRVGAAMKTVIQEGRDSQLSSEAQQSADARTPGDGARYSEVYRLPVRPARPPNPMSG